MLIEIFNGRIFATNISYWPETHPSNLVGMVTPKGYGMEQHDVTTIDGYILTNFRSDE